MRSGLSTNRTSELAQHEIHRPIDVRFPLPGHSSSVFSGGGEELFAFGLNLCLEIGRASCRERVWVCGVVAPVGQGGGRQVGVGTGRSAAVVLRKQSGEW